MPRRKWTEEEKAAFGIKMKALREAKQAAQGVNERLIAQPSEAPQEESVDDLKTRLLELEGTLQKILAGQAAQPLSTAQAGPQGVTGTYEKFTTKATAYPDPRERLSKEPRLARFAFDDNYELGWAVTPVRYKTIDGINTSEPKFTLKLIVKVYDDTTGELTNRRFVILQGVFHEDPDAAIQIAQDNGIEVTADNEKVFLNEMRYLRFRDWLLEAFYPTPPPPSSAKREVVIGNKLVEVYEVNSQTTESMAPFFGTGPRKL